MLRLLTISLYIFFAVLSFHSTARTKQITPNTIVRTPCTALPEGPVTIYIHGTLFPSPVLAQKLTRQGLCLYSSKNCPKEYIDRTLFTASPDKFPEGTFYKFYWSGKLDSLERKKAAEDLFKIISSYKGPLTIIAHSHGCNVALLLAEVAEKNKAALQVDRLVLLAPPVQEATARYVGSPFFKRVYSLYSTADVAQIADPQGLHPTPQPNGPFFSRRTFDNVPHLMQARVLITGQSPGHQDFIQSRFLKQLPGVLDLLDRTHHEVKGHCCINIPLQSKAPYVLKTPYSYSPRRIKYCTCGSVQKREKKAS